MADDAVPIKLVAFTFPLTSNFSVGEFVPIPTLPVVLKVFVPDKVHGFIMAEEPICVIFAVPDTTV